MYLLLTRHGQTVGNVKRILAGKEDPLTREGIKQAKKLAIRLKCEKITAIYTSPHDRCMKTARYIATYHPRVKIQVLVELQEMKHGSYSNKSFDEVDWQHMPKDVENRRSLSARAAKAIAKAYVAHKRGKVLFVSHNALNKAMIRVLRKLDPEDVTKIPQENTALSRYHITQKMVQEVLFNCTKHLRK